MHGKGTYTQNDGTVYKGDFKDNKKNGYGVYIIKSGEWYGDKYEVENRFYEIGSKSGLQEFKDYVKKKDIE